MNALLISIFGKSSGSAAAWQSHAGLAELQPAEGTAVKVMDAWKTSQRHPPKFPELLCPNAQGGTEKTPIPERALMVSQKQVEI